MFLLYLNVEGSFFIIACKRQVKMTLQYFRKLAETKQYRCVLEKGAYLTERIQDDALIMLFQIDRFYIEIFFQLDTDELLGAYCFQNTDELQPYLEQINLDELLPIDPLK